MLTWDIDPGEVFLLRSVESAASEDPDPWMVVSPHEVHGRMRHLLAIPLADPEKAPAMKPRLVLETGFTTVAKNLPALGPPGVVALTDHLRALSVERFEGRTLWTRCSEEGLARLEDGLAYVLGLARGNASYPGTRTRGDVYWVDVGPTTGSEQKKMRPWMVVSPPEVHRHQGHLLALPFTTKFQHAPGHPYRMVFHPEDFTRLDRDGMNAPETLALGDQVRAISHSFFRYPPVARMKPASLLRIDAALAMVTGLEPLPR